MATYKQAGVDSELGDKCSEIAYKAAKATFKGRKGMIGEPVLDEGGFTGMLDMGDYFLVQNDDGIGTKMVVAERMGKYDTMGYDLLCMVVDDAVCVGAEPISVSNTFDVDKVNDKKIAALMKGLEKAALEHKIVIPGGEIAELGDLVKGYVWNATCVGIVEKHKIITGSKIKVGDNIIGLRSRGFRSNGLTLVSHILTEKFGPNWVKQKYDGASAKRERAVSGKNLAPPVLSRASSTKKRTWGEIVLTPSKIFCSAIMEMHGRFGQKAKVELKGVCHVTGGGIPGNLPRILKRTGLGAKLTNLPEPHDFMLKLMEIGKVSRKEAYETWNMGVGMIIISNDLSKIAQICAKHQIEMQVIGEVVKGGEVSY